MVQLRPKVRDRLFWKKLLVWPDLFGIALWAVTAIVYPFPPETRWIQAAAFAVFMAFNALIWFKEIRWMIYARIVLGAISIVSYPLEWTQFSRTTPQETLHTDLLYLALTVASMAGGLGFLRCIEMAKRVPPRLIDPDP